MEASVRTLRWRRRRYALSARVWRVRYGRQFRWAIPLPGGRRLGGRVSLFLRRDNRLAWRVRLVLWAALAAAGGLVLGWVGIAPGLTAAIAAELAFSYRWSASAWLRSRRHGGRTPETRPGCVSRAGRARRAAPERWSCRATRSAGAELSASRAGNAHQAGGPGRGAFSPWTSVYSAASQGPRSSMSMRRTAGSGEGTRPAVAAARICPARSG